MTTALIYVKTAAMAVSIASIFDLVKRQSAMQDEAHIVSEGDGDIVRVVAMDDIPRASWIGAFKCAWAGFFDLHFINEPLWQRS